MHNILLYNIYKYIMANDERNIEEGENNNITTHNNKNNVANNKIIIEKIKKNIILIY